MNAESSSWKRPPLPGDLDDRLRAQLTFLIEVDRLKTVLRQSPLAAADRRENDAEHSWHLAMMVAILAEYSDEPIDLGHTVELVLLHDPVEIYAGNTPLYDTAAGVDQHDRELAAADEIFGILPPDQTRRMRSLWDEFEDRRTPEARFAKAMDRLQPLFLNWMARGGTWQTPEVLADDVRARKAVIGDASSALWAAGRPLIDEGARLGWSRDAAPEAWGETATAPPLSSGPRQNPEKALPRKWSKAAAPGPCAGPLQTADAHGRRGRRSCAPPRQHGTCPGCSQRVSEVVE